jgi:hypothetical protein
MSLFNEPVDTGAGIKAMGDCTAADLEAAVTHARKQAAQDLGLAEQFEALAEANQQADGAETRRREAGKQYRLIIAHDTNEHGTIQIEAHRDVLSDPEGLVELHLAMMFADRSNIGWAPEDREKLAVQQRLEAAKAAAQALIWCLYGVPEVTQELPWMPLAADVNGVLYAAPDDAREGS